MVEGTFWSNFPLERAWRGGDHYSPGRVYLYISCSFHLPHADHCRVLFLTVAVLWYCMDVRSLAKSQSGAVAQKVLIHVYERVFALIFGY